MERHDMAYDHLLSLFAEMILDQAVREFKQRQLYRLIDDALAIGDRQSFNQLSKEWNHLLKFKN